MNALSAPALTVVRNRFYTQDPVGQHDPGDIENSLKKPCGGTVSLLALDSSKTLVEILPPAIRSEWGRLVLPPPWKLRVITWHSLTPRVVSRLTRSGRSKFLNSTAMRCRLAPRFRSRSAIATRKSPGCRSRYAMTSGRLLAGTCSLPSIL